MANWLICYPFAAQKCPAPVSTLENDAIFFDNYLFGFLCLFIIIPWYRKLFLFKRKPLFFLVHTNEII